MSYPDGYPEIGFRRTLQGGALPDVNMPGSPDNNTDSSADRVVGFGAESSLEVKSVGGLGQLALVPEVARIDRRERSVSKFGLRPARLEDVPSMVEVDMRAFSKVYDGYGVGEEVLRADLNDKFVNRYNLIGGEWMPVVTQKAEDGTEKVVGFAVGCPTSKRPDTFVSWEDTTDNGTLNSLYDPHGKNVYVVTLSMDPTVRGKRGYDQLVARLLGNFIREGKELAFFESRMPGLRSWVLRECRDNGHSLSSLSDADRLGLAEKYAALTRRVGGRDVPYDPLLKLYVDDFGCRIEKILPNAYKDGPSMDFGALCTLENPLAKLKRAPAMGPAAWVLGRMLGSSLQAVSRSTGLTRRLMQVI